MTDHSALSPSASIGRPHLDPAVDWRRLAHLFLVSRALDHVEETQLLPERKTTYQFSARGHELGQLLLGAMLTHPHDAAGGYYRSRPLMLALGLSAADSLAGGMGKSGGVSEGRDIGVVHNHPSTGGATGLPTAGGVGTQYSTSAGWARAIAYYRDTLGDTAYTGALAVALGGDGSVATNGFWSALTVATTQRLPMLFYIEDNAYGLSVPSTVQTPGGDIARNLASFGNLRIFNGDGCDPVEAAHLMRSAITHVRSGEGPGLLRLTMPRLSGHSGQDTQAYKPSTLVADEQSRDPLVRLRAAMVADVCTDEEWMAIEAAAAREVHDALADALSRPDPDATQVLRHVFAEGDEAPDIVEPEPVVDNPARINMLTAIRRTLDVELSLNRHMVVFGEDIGPKGGVHAATLGLQDKHGTGRVFDTSLSEEGIIGNAVGMAIAGLRPVAEIQFRKYADPGAEQMHDCGTIRWRTANRFAAPIVVRIPGGFAKVGDPWHSQSNEVEWVHNPGWQVVMPSNAEDAVGLLRAALRSPNPTIFFEHRAMLDAPWARRPYPGDTFVVPIGKGKMVQTGQQLTVVSWGAMVERCVQAVAVAGVTADIIDLRSLAPWDRELVLSSVRRTRRCLIVHEDTLTAGTGAEIAAVVAHEGFFDLDAPVTRLATPDVPLPYNTTLMDAVLPSVDAIVDRMTHVLSF
jgi:2-oxoisovalerate dehydrogenase E1 component